MDSIDNYRIFYEVAKYKNITRASEHLYISQPAVSQAIKKIEEQLGTTLFIRNKKGVELTRFGQEVFQKVETAMLSLETIDKISRDEHELLRGSVVIGSGSNVAREMLTLPIKNFLDNFPCVQIIQMEDIPTKLFQMLRKGEVDIVITQQNEQFNEFSFCEIKKHNYVFIKKKGGEVKRFIKTPQGSFTYNLFEEFEKQNKFENYPATIVSGYRMEIELVKQGVGIALVPEFLVSNFISSGEVEVIFKDYKLPSITFGYYYNPTLLTTATEVFMKFLEE